MSDNDENLISQDDIDQLLDASALDDLDLSPGDGDADMGELTQEDIDNLLKDEPDGLPDVLAEEVDPFSSEDDLDDSLFGNDLDSLIAGDGIDGVADEPDIGAEDGGELSQDDIDALLNPVTQGETEETEDLFPEEDVVSAIGDDPILSDDDPVPVDAGGDTAMPKDDSDLVSQDDIDQLLMGADGTEADGGDPEDLGMDDDDDELISLEDIQGLLAEEDAQAPDPEPAPAQDAPPATDAADDPSGEAAMEERPPDDAADPVAPDSPGEMEDMDLAAVDGADPAENPGEDDGLDLPGDDPVDLSEGELDDGIISPEEAVSMEDSLLTQETLDKLTEAYDAEEKALNPDPDELLAELEAEEEMESLGELDVVALDEEDPLAADPLAAGTLGDEPAEDDLPPGEDEEGEVTQEDIDALLMESSDTDEEIEDDEDILISQEDIDTLLMAADQEDEDVLGNLGEDIEDTGLGDDLDSDGLFDQEGDAPEAGEQIILEEGEDGADPAKAKARNQWYKSRILVAALSVVLVLGISIPSAYFIFFSGGDEMPMDAPLPMPQETAAPNDALTGPVVQVTTAPPVQSQSGTLLLADFVVLAPDQSKEMTFISTDVSIDYSDQRAYHEINRNMSYYRGLIYDAIQKNLTWEKRDEVTQPDLLWEIETTLKKVLPPQYIDAIRFKGFKTS